MMTLERSPSHSWWWNSHNSPKHSKWLQSNLQELDEKVREMLRLIEEDADSFAKRAEMYYQKRPELVNLVEEFYRAYRSLAERYDHLAGEIRHNIPKALQVQFGLSCDSPKSLGRQHHYFPLRKSDQTFDDLLNKVGKAEEEMKDNHLADKLQTPECKPSNGPNHSNIEHSSRNGQGDFALEFCTRDDNCSSKGSSSDAEADHYTPLEKLQQEIETLEMENKLLTDSHEKVVQLNNALEKKVEALEDQCRSIQNKAELLTDEVGSSKEQVGVDSCSHKSTKVGTVLREGSCVDGYKDASCFEGLGMDSNLRNDGDVIEYQNQDYMINMDTLQRKSSLLIEENEVLKQAIVERGEEKREAISQLCLSIDVLKHENQRLLALLALTKKRLHPLQPAWMKFLCLGG